MNMRQPCPPREDIAALKEKCDEWWYTALLEPSFCGTKLRQEEKYAIIRRSVAAAESVYCDAVCRYRGQSAEAIVRTLGLGVSLVTRDDVFGNENILALYEPGENSILLCEENIAALLKYIDEYGLSDIVGKHSIWETALYHECFHALEERTPGIYTRSRMLKRKFLCFDVHLGFDSSGEIGAIHFSKLMSGLDFSPCLYEYLLICMNGNAIPHAWR